MIGGTGIQQILQDTAYWLKVVTTWLIQQMLDVSAFGDNKAIKELTRYIAFHLNMPF